MLLTQDEINAVILSFDTKDWNKYWKLSPHGTGVLTFSRVGFNSAKTRAFVYAAEVCGPLCGSGYTFVLDKTNGVWELTEEKRCGFHSAAPNKSGINVEDDLASIFPARDTNGETEQIFGRERRERDSHHNSSGDA